MCRWVNGENNRWADAAGSFRDDDLGVRQYGMVQ